MTAATRRGCSAGTRWWRTHGLDELEKRIRFNGFYPYRCDRGEYERLECDTAYREAVFTQLMVDEVRRWIRLAEERLEGTGINCLVSPATTTSSPSTRRSSRATW